MQQLDLFPVSVRAPQGFLYQPEFLSEADEAELLLYLRGLKLKNYEHGEYIAKRKVRWFTGTAMPVPIQRLRNAVAQWAGINPERIDNALVSKYEAGAPIGLHRDRPPYHTVLGVSLGSACRFRLRKRYGKGWKRFMQIA